jgi:bacteriorhodopsin
MTQLWLWIGLTSMVVGAIVFGTGAHRARSERWRILFTLNFFITTIASVLYLAMVMGQGKGVFYGNETFWVRYVTWFLSTPLLLLVLSHLGRNRIATVGALIGANAAMIATGFLATISPRPINYVWYLVSCGFYVGEIFLLLGKYRNEAEQNNPGKIGKSAFSRLLAMHITIWTAYPVVWILAGTGFGLLSSGFEGMFYTLLDITSKVGFGLVSLNTLRQLEQIPDRSDVPVEYPQTSGVGIGAPVHRHY